jgi:hypothetical protein
MAIIANRRDGECRRSRSESPAEHQIIREARFSSDGPGHCNPSAWICESSASAAEEEFPEPFYDTTTQTQRRDRQHWFTCKKAFRVDACQQSGMFLRPELEKPVAQRAERSVVHVRVTREHVA